MKLREVWQCSNRRQLPQHRLQVYIHPFVTRTRAFEDRKGTTKGKEEGPYRSIYLTKTKPGAGRRLSPCATLQRPAHGSTAARSILTAPPAFSTGTAQTLRKGAERRPDSAAAALPPRGPS